MRMRGPAEQEEQRQGKEKRVTIGNDVSSRQAEEA